MYHLQLSSSAPERLLHMSGDIWHLEGEKAKWSAFSHQGVLSKSLLHFQMFNSSDSPWYRAVASACLNPLLQFFFSPWCLSCTLYSSLSEFPYSLSKPCTALSRCLCTCLITFFLTLTAVSPGARLFLAPLPQSSLWFSKQDKGSIITLHYLVIMQ